MLANYVPVYVMLPLGIVNAENVLENIEVVEKQLKKLRAADVDGVMVDVWCFNYIFQTLRFQLSDVLTLGTTLELIVMILLKVPRNDAANPSGQKPGDLLIQFKVRDDSLFQREGADIHVDAVLSVTQETCVQCSFSSLLEECYDKYLRADFEDAATKAGHPEWTLPDDAGTYNDTPESTGFFKSNGTYLSEKGKFLLTWYSNKILFHGSVETPVELLHGKHVTDFAILVSFGAVKFPSVDHS